MTLSGVLKDILLVMASMLIFRDPVSGIQALGYSVALCGLVYYKLGVSNIKEYVGHGQRAWADYGVRHPALRKVLVLGVVFGTVLLLFGAASSTGTIPPDYDPAKIALKKLYEAMGRTNE